MKRKSYRKELKIPKHFVLGIYGKLVYIWKCKAYCDLHKCYLKSIDIQKKKCRKKKCKHLKQLGKYKEWENE